MPLSFTAKIKHKPYQYDSVTLGCALWHALRNQTEVNLCGQYPGVRQPQDSHDRQENKRGLLF